MRKRNGWEKMDRME